MTRTTKTTERAGAMKRLFVLAVAALAGAAWAAGNVRPEETVECPVSANMRGHENTEWSIYYGYHLTDANRGLPRVLLVGDSICNGYQRGVAQILEGKMNVSYWVSSYCVTSPGYLKRLALCLDEAKYDVVHFNNGLHSLGTPTDDWAKGLEAALKLIRARQPSARIIWTTSTPLKDPGRTAFHDSVILNFNMLGRYLSGTGHAAEWRETLGYEEDDPMNRKRIGDFACWIAFVAGINAR